MIKWYVRYIGIVMEYGPEDREIIYNNHRFLIKNYRNRRIIPERRFMSRILKKEKKKSTAKKRECKWKSGVEERNHHFNR